MGDTKARYVVLYWFIVDALQNDLKCTCYTSSDVLLIHTWPHSMWHKFSLSRIPSTTTLGDGWCRQSYQTRQCCSCKRRQKHRSIRGQTSEHIFNECSRGGWRKVNTRSISPCGRGGPCQTTHCSYHQTISGDIAGGESKNQPLSILFIVYLLHNPNPPSTTLASFATSI